MGIFGMFRKKKNVDKSKNVSDVPLSKVEELVNKGLSKRQIVDFLKSDGYSVDLVEKAFSQLTSKQGVLSDTGAPVSEGLEPLSAPSDGLPLPSELPPLDSSLDSLEPDVEGEIRNVGDVEGLVEVIVEEKFSEMVDKLEDLDSLKESIAGSIDSFRSDLSSLNEKVVELEKFRDENVVAQKQTLDEIRLEMGAMEKAFHKLVPSLSANIRELREGASSKKGVKKGVEKELSDVSGLLSSKK
jgi:hypothetical protein